MYVGKQPLPNYDYEDQGNFGTCVGNGVAHQLEYEALEVLPGQQLKFSPLFIYRNAKIIEGNTDEGTNPALAYQALVKQGVCLESDFPYTLLTDVHNLPTPTQQATQNALKYKIKSFTQLDTTTDAIDKALDSGKVVNVGTVVVSNFVDAGNEEYIGVAEGTILGGHDYVIIGRDDEKSHTFSDNTTLTGFYHLQNSWARQQTAWVAKAYIGGEYDVDFHAKILQGAWIVDTGWGNVQPQPTPSPKPIPVPSPSPVPKPSIDPKPIPQPQYKEKIEMWIGNKKVIVNGFEHAFDVAPVLDQTSGRTLVELRFLSEVNGWNVVWDEKEQKIELLR